MALIEDDTYSSDAGNGHAGQWQPGRFALRDAWFPIAHTPTLVTKPLRRTIHSEPYFLWRDGGRIRATAYHPSNNRDRRSLSDFSDPHGDYPVLEKYGHIWAWYGNPANAEPSLVPDIPFLPKRRAQPAYAWGVNFMHCTYELVLENILDLTHTDFIHSAYAGVTEDFEQDDVTFESTSETVTMVRTVKGRPTSRYQRDVLGIAEAYQDQTAFTHVFIRSGMCFLHSHYSTAPSIPLMQSNTPESRLLTRANFAFGIQQTGDKNFAREWPKTATIIGQQDESVLNPQNPRYVLQKPKPDCSTRFDAAGLHFRKRYMELVSRQERGDFAYLRDAEEGSRLSEILKIKRQH